MSQSLEYESSVIQGHSQSERPFIRWGELFVFFIASIHTVFAEPADLTPKTSTRSNPVVPTDDLPSIDSLTRATEELSKQIRADTPIDGPGAELIAQSGLPPEVLEELLSGAPGVNVQRDIETFPERYSKFVARLNEAFRDKARYETRRDFTRAIERNRFQDPEPGLPREPGLGRFEAKIFNNRVVVRFVTGEDTLHPKSIFINPDHGIEANEGIKQFSIEPPKDGATNTSAIDPEISDRQLDIYRSRHMMNRDLHGPLKIVGTFVYRITQGEYANLFRNLVGEPYKGLYYVRLTEEGVTEKSWTPPVESFFSKRYWDHRKKGTIEKLRYGNYVLGAAAGGIELITGMTFVVAAHLYDPAKFALDFISPAIWTAYSFLLATNADAYNRTVELGNNRFWQAAKRLQISAIPSYLCLFLTNMAYKGMPLHDALASLTSLQSTFLVLAVGFGDRYLSTVMNVGPKIIQRFFLKPWWFPERVKTPGREFVADLLGKPEIKHDTIKGVLLTREVLAKIRFPFKFGALFIDANLMQHTTIHINGVDLPVPVASLLLWVVGIPFEVFNYFYVKKVAKEEPAVIEELRDFERNSILRWFFPKALRRIPETMGKGFFHCATAVKAFATSLKDTYYPPF